MFNVDLIAINSIATVISAIATCIATIFAFRSLKLSTENNQPYIFLTLKNDGNTLYLVIQNSGNNVAKEVEVNINKQHKKRYISIPNGERKAIRVGYTSAMGNIYKIEFDEIKLSYKNPRGKQFQESYTKEDLE